MGFTKYNHLKSCIHYANALLLVIIFIRYHYQKNLRTLKVCLTCIPIEMGGSYRFMKVCYNKSCSEFYVYLFVINIPMKVLIIPVWYNSCSDANSYAFINLNISY